MWDFLWAFSHPLLHKFHRDIYVYPREAQFEHNRCNYKCTWRAQPSAKANVTIFRDQDLHQNINGFSFAHASPLQQVSWNSACYVWDNRADRQRNEQLAPLKTHTHTHTDATHSVQHSSNQRKWVKTPVQWGPCCIEVYELPVIPYSKIRLLTHYTIYSTNDFFCKSNKSLMHVPAGQELFSFARYN